MIDCVIDWFDAKIQLPLEGVGTNIQNVGELNVADLPINLVNANFFGIQPNKRQNLQACSYFWQGIFWNPTNQVLYTLRLWPKNFHLVFDAMGI